MRGEPRCAAIHDYTESRAIRCRLKPGHAGIHKPGGWENLVGSTLVLVKTLQKRAQRRTGS